jgi:hypothetical protein
MSSNGLICWDYLLPVVGNYARALQLLQQDYIPYRDRNANEEEDTP